MIGTRTRFLPLAVALVLWSACDSSSPPSQSSSDQLRCDPNAEPILLASKLDDDDGDGYPFDEHFPEIDDEDDDIADHTWIRDHQGWYHLFFQNEGRGKPNFIEHYRTRDLKTLEYLGHAMFAQPGTWDAGGLWAPHIIEVKGTYYMFYTGIDHLQPGATQRIGVAVSTDLTHWTRPHVNRCPGTTGDGCIYECRSSWTTFGDDSDVNNQQCRDAFVMYDDENNRWLMFATARSTNGYGVITVAYSDDLTTWHSLGYIDATRRLANGVGGQPTGGQCENPFVVSREGKNYLIFTDWQDPEDSLDVATPRTIAQYAASTSLDIDSLGSAGWSYEGYIPNPGVNAIEVIHYRPDLWIMSQSLSNPHSGYVKPIRRMLVLRCMDFGPGFSFTTSNVGFGDPLPPSSLSGP
ncbi:MAG TPA: family 43 glycosylhydrolase [Candidatus Krumholzibacteria bacterium]|nr:family 43 glycosylhydrolase [Candidatus Krumholzibacteria bacterium]